MCAAEPAAGQPVSKEPLLRVRGLAVRYRRPDGPPTVILEDIDFELAAGQTLGILGESGCGKTTLANAILGILPRGGRIAGGSVLLNGRDLVGLDEEELGGLRGRAVALISQEPSLALSPVLRVGGQIADVLTAHRALARAEARPLVEELLARVRFDDPGRIHDSYPHQLSGGQLQRIVVARAIACRPQLLIADEPTASVDAMTQREILGLLAELQQELDLAMIFVSHDPALLARVSHHILVMYAGRVAEIGTRDQVLGQPLHPYTRALLACAPRRGPRPENVDGEHLVTIGGAPPPPSQPLPGCRFEPRCPARTARCAERPPRPVSPRADHRVSCFEYGG